MIVFPQLYPLKVMVVYTPRALLTSSLPPHQHHCPPPPPSPLPPPPLSLSHHPLLLNAQLPQTCSLTSRRCWSLPSPLQLELSSSYLSLWVWCSACVDSREEPQSECNNQHIATGSPSSLTKYITIGLLHLQCQWLWQCRESSNRAWTTFTTAIKKVAS